MEDPVAAALGTPDTVTAAGTTASTTAAIRKELYILEPDRERQQENLAILVERCIPQVVAREITGMLTKKQTGNLSSLAMILPEPAHSVKQSPRLQEKPIAAAVVAEGVIRKPMPRPAAPAS